ncbi:unnamed protein product [Paramecium primaurelia]|uniref:Transmembrane protein n=1 Tax=Paramecium primaurelia TaxID=5886 RepID=A0A8S1MY30_PARPR|nr:unnamed protein product [Paramecium primaurelia]
MQKNLFKLFLQILDCHYIKIIFMIIFIYLHCLYSTKSFEIQTLDPLYQVAHQQVMIGDKDFAPTKYFSYGIWSKYNPLSPIPQTGPVGLFDSNCYQLHHILDQRSNEINLIYYDCLDYEANLITKSIKFVNNENQQKTYEIEIEPFEYEDFWFFLEIIQWPFQKRFEILIISQQKTIIHKIDEINFPFKGIDLQFTFGSSLIVSNPIIESIQKDQKFSYFPGTIIIQRFKIEDELLVFDWFEYVKSIFEQYEFCICQGNTIQKLQDQNIKYLFKGEFVSDNQNCDSFILSGWFKIQEIINEQDSFTYPFIKLAANFEDPNLSSDNLSPLNIKYKISDIQNQVIVTTYSYTFPTVSIDFSNNPFLIEKQFDIVHNMKLWHKIQVKLVQNIMDIQITFYDEFTVHEYSHQVEVRQFQQQQFKLLYGNIQQLKKNYLQLQIRNFFLLNCDETFSDQNCHYSCQECDGPTNENCLSCSEESKRIYLPEHKVCVCPENTIDDQICIGYKEANLEIMDEPFIDNECQYGYFELNNECYKCPSIIRKDLIICLDCVQNPKYFSKKLYCLEDLYLSQTSNTEKIQYSQLDQFLFDGDDFHIYHGNEQQIQIDDEEQLYINFQQESVTFDYFCQNINIYYRCEEFIYINCEVYYFSIVGVICIQCDRFQILKNGQCIYPDDKKYCHTPYYITHTNECKLCLKQNCIYCFEYQNDESSFKSTLYKNFGNFNEDQIILVGCAMCQDGYIFDFTIGECQRQQSKIETCLRSFINQKGIEMCTLSSQTDFSVAPEIINCEKYYSNCQQCVLTPKSKLQCVLCKQGYVSSVITGNCQDISQPELQQNSIYVTQGDYLEDDGYIQTLQSFLMLFLPDKYYYSYSPQQLVEFSIKCQYGYELTKDLQCKEYCESDCLNCQKDKNNFICMTCYLNYYRKHIKSEINGKCITCSNLCQFCEQRNQIDYLYELSSSIQEKESDNQFSMKCLKPVDHPNIIMNPYLQIAKYCLKENCQNQFSISRYFTQCQYNSHRQSIYEEDINYKYCNLVGVDQMTINYIIQYEELDIECDFSNEEPFLNNFKKKIFTLKKTKSIFYALNNNLIVTSRKINIINFDSVEVKNITLILFNGFNIQNNNNKVDITFKNIIINRSNITEITILPTSVYGSILIQDVYIIDSIFVNSKFFEVNKQFFQVKIQKLTFKNSLLNNSLLFNIGYNQKMITIENIIIENCSMYNSSFFYFETDLINQNQIKLFDIEIYQCNFTFSYFINTNTQFEIIGNNLFFHNNNLQNSVIIGFNDNLELITIRTSQNNLIESSIISSLLIINQQRVVCKIDDFEDNQSFFQESSLISIYSSLQINNFIVTIKNVKVYENQILNTFLLENSLIKLHCHYFQVQNAQFFQLQNIIVFYLFEINQIIFDSVIFENSQQEHKVPVSSFCNEQVQFKSQLLKVIGFQQLSLSNIKIVNQFSINYSIIDINFSVQYIIDLIGQIILTNVQFQGNILLKDKQATLVSLVNIQSQFNLNIKLINIQFTQNILNQQIDDPFDTQTNLLHISSLDSFVYINHIYCYQNALTNSTNQFITITATLIEVYDFIFMKQNMLPQTLWQQFYDFELDDEYNQQQITSIIQSTFKLLNQGIYIVASTFICSDSIFQDIIALKSSIFQINTQREGIIKINNIQINNVQINLKESGSTGCISIDSTNSLLNIELKQIKFTNIFNRMAASLFTITPSLKQNIIRLNNIEIKNCLSLINSIIFIKFLAQTMSQSLVSINNLSIYQSEEVWIQLYSLIGQIKLSELDNILSQDNAMIFLENCKTEIKNLNFEGIIIYPILKFQNAFKLKLLDCNLVSVQRIYSFDLIHISQTLQTQSTISIENLKIIQTDNQYQKNVGIPIQLDLNYKIVGCNVWRPTQIISEIIFSDIISQMQSYNQQSNQIMYVKSISQQNLLMFQQIKLMNNNGSDFLNGIMTFELQKFKILKLSDIFCYMNSMRENGCIHFLIQNFINQTVGIKDSYFIKNNGSKGGAIQIQNVKLRMRNCKIMYNQVSQSGGGLFLQQNGSDFLIKSTIIIDNEALNGGGIYFSQDTTLHQHNFIKSLLLFNKAIEFGNNLIESPHHLELLLNNMEMQSKKQIIKQILNCQLILKPYKIIEQGMSFFTDYLMIPSNQIIQGYQIYEPKSTQYYSYITNFGLILKNGLNEQLPNSYNTNCIFISKIINEESLDQEGKQTDQKILQFDYEKDYYELGSHSFTLDPYDSEKKLLQIEISCQSSEKLKILNYIIKTKSLRCQLGEFYINSGCQPCSSSQGFYSVEYDAKKCSIFDQTKFKNITENNIELQEGFWRPNYLSDKIEECFKNLKFCKGGWGQGNQICDLGHIGALCEECDIYNIRGDGKYFKNQQDSQCISCYGVQDSIIPFIAASLWSFISIIITLRSIEQSNQLFKCLKLQQRFSKIIFNLEQGHESFLIKMLLNYLWIFSAIFTFNIQFSFSIGFVDSASNTSYSMTNNLDCYLSENQTIKLIYSKILTMLVLMILQFIFIIIGFLCYNCYQKIGLRNFNLEIISNTLLYLYISNYGGLVKMYFSILSKRDVSNQSYIQGDVSLLFGSREHLIWIYSFVIPGIGIFSLLIPFSLFIVMYIRKDQHDNIKIRKHFCYLINEYNVSSYFWEDIKLIKKTIIILILTYFETYILLKASLLGLSLLFYQLIAFNKKPYILSNFNSMDLFSAQICSISIFLAATKYVAEQENNQFSSISLQTIIVLLCIKLCYSFIKSILEVYFNKYFILVLNYLYIIFNKISSNSIFTKKLQNYLQKSNQRNNRLKILIKKLRQHLLTVSKAQLENHRKILSTQIKKTQSWGSEQKYLLKIDTE